LGLVSLELLDLSNNMLAEVELNTLKGLFNLKYVYLQNNKIELVDVLIKKNNLITIDIIKNKLMKSQIQKQCFFIIIINKNNTS
jgi:Leucine-rich repeat (LRR) protein